MKQMLTNSILELDQEGNPSADVLFGRYALQATKKSQRNPGGAKSLTLLLR
ncbi:predicted protein [Sclerotinia sclerotiorum 1980 UF-70]|uniref:Uncharacterized protein n=1 Tax=Sclerotinia sclerotiorum (strain ATCC 18683 / 1980 / Ss-1) TaxID=665079 RepID=A7EJL2_SCLS1|nr:predicted protein [Sclerotinia sclerotiorum 1980 UF-70]EDO03028.1 predicted protein [Sclerotinia sclerotiorum 1980 UF-70]